MEKEDNEGPILPPGSPDPGRMSPCGTWEGEFSWRRRQEDGSIMKYEAGILVEIENLLLPSRARVTAKPVDWPECKVWRIPSEGGGYIWGEIEVSVPKGCTFKRNDALWEDIKKLAVHPNPTELEKSLLSSEELKEAVADEGFAKRLYGALCNQDWYHPEFGEQSLSWRAAGRIVALIRNRGEDYMDFYGSGNEGTSDDKVREYMEKIGWSDRPPMPSIKFPSSP